MSDFLSAIFQLMIIIASLIFVFGSCTIEDVNEVATNTGEMAGNVVKTVKKEVFVDGDEFADEVTTSIELSPDLTSLPEATLRSMLEDAFLGGVQHQAETANQKGNCMKFGELLVECVNTIELNGVTHKIHTECESDPYEETITCKAE